MGDPETDPVELTPRRCRYCRRLYLAAKGSRPHACPACAPTIEDAIAAVGPTGASRDAETAPLVPRPDASPASAIASPEPFPEPPHWTLSECQVKGCGQDAEVNVEGWLVCAEHADDWLDRLGAIALPPELRELLPGLGDR